MSIRTTVTLEEDVLEKVRHESRARGTSFRDTLNDLLRTALLNLKEPPKRRTLRLEPIEMGLRQGLSYDDIEALIEHGEGSGHR